MTSLPIMFYFITAREQTFQQLRHIIHLNSGTGVQCIRGSIRDCNERLTEAETNREAIAICCTILDPNIESFLNQFLNSASQYLSSRPLIIMVRDGKQLRNYARLAERPATQFIHTELYEDGGMQSFTAASRIVMNENLVNECVEAAISSPQLVPHISQMHEVFRLLLDTLIQRSQAAMRDSKHGVTDDLLQAAASLLHDWNEHYKLLIHYRKNLKVQTTEQYRNFEERSAAVYEIHNLLQLELTWRFYSLRFRINYRSLQLLGKHYIPVRSAPNHIEELSRKEVKAAFKTYIQDYMRETRQLYATLRTDPRILRRGILIRQRLEQHVGEVEFFTQLAIACTGQQVEETERGWLLYTPIAERILYFRQRIAMRQEARANNEYGLTLLYLLLELFAGYGYQTRRIPLFLGIFVLMICGSLFIDGWLFSHCGVSFTAAWSDLQLTFANLVGQSNSISVCAPQRGLILGFETFVAYFILALIAALLSDLLSSR